MLSNILCRLETVFFNFYMFSLFIDMDKHENIKQTIEIIVLSYYAILKKLYTKIIY